MSRIKWCWRYCWRLNAVTTLSFHKENTDNQYLISVPNNFVRNINRLLVFGQFYNKEIWAMDCLWCTSYLVYSCYFLLFILRIDRLFSMTHDYIFASDRSVVKHGFSENRVLGSSYLPLGSSYITLIYYLSIQNSKYQADPWF